jgi:hypothetical protein
MTGCLTTGCLTACVCSEAVRAEVDQKVLEYLENLRIQGALARAARGAAASGENARHTRSPRGSGWREGKEGCGPSRRRAPSAAAAVTAAAVLCARSRQEGEEGQEGRRRWRRRREEGEEEEGKEGGRGRRCALTRSLAHARMVANLCVCLCALRGLVRGPGFVHARLGAFRAYGIQRADGSPRPPRAQAERRVQRQKRRRFGLCRSAVAARRAQKGKKGGKKGKGKSKDKCCDGEKACASKPSDRAHQPVDVCVLLAHGRRPRARASSVGAGGDAAQSGGAEDYPPAARVLHQGACACTAGGWPRLTRLPWTAR